MAKRADARQRLLLEILAHSEDPRYLEDLGQQLQCDPRTVRRDLDELQRLLQKVRNIEVRRGKVFVTRSEFSPGYFTSQLERNMPAKEAIARVVVRSLPDGAAIALTAGSTPYVVAREIRRTVVEGLPPHDLIVFTNSLPALLELIAASIMTGVLGEIYSTEDCALHAPEFHSAFQPGIAIIGVSGLVFGVGIGLELFSHRAEEAAFMKQLLANVPEVIIAVDRSKLGNRHPWSFGGSVLHNKRVRLVTDRLSAEQREELDALCEWITRYGMRFSYEVATDSRETVQGTDAAE